jgi:DNA-directed RNA polymerase subunit RPC12/RpoP
MLRATCEDLNTKTRPIVERMKQSRFRSTSRRYILEHKKDTTEKTESACSDEVHSTDSDRGSDDDSDSDIDPDIEQEPSEDHGKSTWFISFVEDVLLYTNCLTQLGNALECPAPEAKHDIDTDTTSTLVSSKESQNKDAQPESIPVKSVKAYACTICGKTFSRNFHLKNHEASHRGERPYECPECKKAFSRLNDCKRHQKLHERR